MCQRQTLGQCRPTVDTSAARPRMTRGESRALHARAQPTVGRAVGPWVRQTLGP
eukprot:CAMPEP_0194761214 /NCGR_PEP_ID=MMETSP0323_2-20130528/13967_1 /TAXON_ID=2866 ORGANISM="Crypthecodinium cohnii, Strain Seligo" /NCGR_SAMPLE_ID=MMETSP0323_2 /ASSEMBLY_ACC=CAM_ASM_000346 /LENGTH=53 /DNA_ID=CAMNT_0039682845 /DNA_START=186 /DNA_END=343 /DNA_ORIENTATION=+